MNDTFKERLNDAFKKSGMSMAEFEKKSGIFRGNLQNYLEGIHFPSRNKLIQLSRALEVDARWLKYGYGLSENMEDISDSIMRTDTAYISDSVINEALRLPGIDEIKKQREKETQLSYDEQRIILAYRKANSRTKDIILKILELK